VFLLCKEVCPAQEWHLITHPVPAWKLLPSLSMGEVFWPKALAEEELSPCYLRKKSCLKATLTKARCPYCYLCLPLLLPPSHLLPRS